MGTTFRERMALVPPTPAFSPFVVHLYGGTSVKTSAGLFNLYSFSLALGNAWRTISKHRVSNCDRKTAINAKKK